MSIQTIQRSGGDFGSQLGAGLGNVLSAGLQGLAESKLQQLQRQQEYKSNLAGLQALGVSNAEQLANLDQSSLQQLIKAKLEEPSREAYAQSLQAILGGQEAQPQTVQQPQPQAAQPTQQASAQIAQPQNQQQQIQPQQQELPLTLESITPQQKQQLDEYLRSPFAKQSMKPDEILKVKNFLSAPTAPQAQPATAQQPATQQAPVIKGGLNEKQATELAKLGFEKQKMTAAEKRHEKQLENDLRKEALKETKEVRKELFAKKKAAQETIEALDRLEELEKEGLPNEAVFALYKNAGFDLPSLLGEKGEEYNKVTANFVRNAKAIFGSRLTDADLNQFLKTVPSLSNSPEGRKRINANLKRVASLDKAAVDAYEDILKENKGIPPFDLELQLDKALDKKRESIAKQFKKDLAKEVPPAQNKALVGLAGVTGKAASLLPGALAGAGAGALSGALGGPVGIGLGALGGGAANLLYNLFGKKNE